MSSDYPTLFGCSPGSAGRVVVVGLPYDRGTLPEHAGSASAPRVLRELSAPKELRIKDGALYDLGRREVLFPGHFMSDLGDLKFRPSQSDDAYHGFVSHAVSLIGQERKRPLILGGDHLVTLFALRGLARSGRPVQVVQLDAHHDCEGVAPDERPTHATFVSFVMAEGLARQVLQIGARGLSWGPPTMPAGVASIALDELRSALLPGVEVYLTVDTDAFDPSIAGAVAYPEPNGLPFGALENVLDVLRAADAQGAGADWTEYNPALDNSNRLTGRFIVRGLADIAKYLSDEE